MSDTPVEIPTQTDQSEQKPGPVPYARFHELTQRHQQVTAELDRMRAELVARTERASQAEALAKQLSDLQAAHETAAASWSEERTFLGVGLADPEGQALARTLHGLLPAEGRPDVGTWLRGQIEGGQVHPALSHYFGGTARAPASAPAAPSPAPPMPRPSGAGGTQPPSAAPVYSAEQIRALREEAQRTGDLSKLRAAMPHISASLQRPHGR